MGQSVYHGTLERVDDKDVDRVVDIVERARLSKKVARLRPIGVIKG